MDDWVVKPEDLQLEQLDLKAQMEYGFRPRQDVAAWPLTFPIDWAANPFSDRNWCFQLSGWKMLDPYISEYLASKDADRLREAVRFIADWHRFCLVENKQFRFKWYDMSTGQRATRLAFIIEHARAGILNLSGEEMEMLLHVADAHLQELSVEDAVAPNNHGIFQVLGLFLLARVVGDKKEGEDFARDQYRKIMKAQFTEEGVHTENSPDYHFFVMNTMQRSRAADLLGDPFGGKLEAIKAVRPWLVFPNGEIARVGDSGSKSDPLSEDPANPAILDDGRRFAVGDFTKSGYAIIRSLPSEPQSSMIFVTGMAHTVDHKHADELSFELFEFGRFIFIDGGKFGYKSDPMRDYVKSTDAHNSIGLADRVVSPEDVKLEGGLLLPIVKRPSSFMIEGRCVRPNLFTHRRTLAYSPGRHLRISDIVSSDEDHDYISSLLVAPDLTPEMTEDGFIIQVGGQGLVRAKLLADGAMVSTSRGRTNPNLGWYSAGYLQMEPATVIRASCRGRNRAIEWDITFEDLD